MTSGNGLIDFIEPISGAYGGKITQELLIEGVFCQSSTGPGLTMVYPVREIIPAGSRLCTDDYTSAYATLLYLERGGHHMKVYVDYEVQMSCDLGDVEFYGSREFNFTTSAWAGGAGPGFVYHLYTH